MCHASPQSLHPPGPRGHRPLCLTWHPELGRVHENLRATSPMNFPFICRSRSYFLLLQKEGLKIAYENVQMFKCSLKKHWRLIEATQNPSCIFFSGEWSDTSPRNMEHPKLLTTARRVPAQVMSFRKPEVIFLLIWSFIKQLIQNLKHGYLKMICSIHTQPPQKKSLHLKRDAVGKSFPCRTICSKKAEEVQQTNKSNTWTKKTFQTSSWLAKAKQHFNTFQTFRRCVSSSTRH